MLVYGVKACKYYGRSHIHRLINIVIVRVFFSSLIVSKWQNVMTGAFSFSFFHLVLFDINKQLKEERKWPISCRLHDQPRNDLHIRSFHLFLNCTLYSCTFLSLYVFLKNSTMDKSNKAAILSFNLEWVPAYISTMC